MPTRYRIRRTQLRDLIKGAVLASQNGGREICGLIIDTGYSLDLKQVQNKSKRGGRFAFYVNAVKGFEKAVSLLNYHIVGTFHSHPYYIAEPAGNDLTGSEDGELMLVIDCLNSQARLWRIQHGSPKSVKYELL